MLALNKLIRNAISTRAAWLSKLLDPRRDIDKECGHPSELVIEDFKEAYERGDLAARVVDVYPEETWSDDPEVFETEDENETEFEKAWDELEEKHGIYSVLMRADRLSGIGRFGVVLIGVNDGLSLDQPVASINEKGESSDQASESELLYLRAFDETFVTIDKLESDPSNPRYGLPVSYSITFESAQASGFISDGTVATSSKKVHWTRIIHIADNVQNSIIYGAPRMKLVMNRLLDLKKIAGGSAEMFWKGGFPGLSIESNPGLEGFEFDADATEEQMEKYMNGLQRYIALTGMTAKSLSPQIADPRSHLELQIRLIAMAMSVPWRILMGVEVGQLAGEQDMRAWNRRLKRRQDKHATTNIVKPLIDRFLAMGILPPVSEDGYIVEWLDLNSPSDDEKAGVAEKKTNALAKYVAGGVDALISPHHFLTLILGLTQEEAMSVIDAAENRVDALEITPEPEPAPMPGKPIKTQPTPVPAR